MGKTKELRKEIAAREQKLKKSEAKAERQFVNGKFLTDRNAMNRTDVSLREKHNRAVPKKLAKMGMMAIESRGTGVVAEEGEVTDRISQEDILKSVDIQTQRKKFDLTLNELGPYTLDFTQNGAYLGILGLRGHLATMKWQDHKLIGETQLKDKCTDMKFLVDNSMMAVAQKRYVYMYTKEGAEMHILSKMPNMDKLEFLNRHQLLVGTSSTYSTMIYLDVSTGKELGLKVPSVMRDPTTCLRANPANGVVGTCDTRGVVKMWSPSVVDPLVQIKGHNGAIQDIAFHMNGRYFVTLGAVDHKMKVWDARMLRTLETYPAAYTFNTIDISANGLVALGGGTRVEVWKKMFSSAKPDRPYLKHGLGYANVAQRVRFVPFEDVLGVGHSNGFSSVLIPGSGESNPDFYYANPYETDRHRQERVVRTLLDKLQPDTISMDLRLGDVDEEKLEEYAKNLAANRKAKRIRDKKARRADTSRGDDAPTGLLPVSDEFQDEVDEELGFKEKGVTRAWKSKKDLQAEKKKARWDKKDTADKVRSKQTMRHSRMVQRERHIRRLNEAEGHDVTAGDGGDGDDHDYDDEDTPNAKKRRTEKRGAERSAARQRWAGSAALGAFA